MIELTKGMRQMPEFGNTIVYVVKKIQCPHCNSDQVHKRIKMVIFDARCVEIFGKII